MQTIGYWCDVCRTKYVRHECKTALPCRHSIFAAIMVYAKAYGRGGEEVEMQIPITPSILHGLHRVIHLEIHSKPRNRQVDYIGTEAKMLFAHTVAVRDVVRDT